MKQSEFLEIIELSKKNRRPSVEVLVEGRNIDFWNKRFRIAVTINITDESLTYTLLNYNYFALFSEIEILGQHYKFDINGLAPFTWQFNKPGKYTFNVTLRPGLPDNTGSPVFIGIQNVITSISLPDGIETLPLSFFATMNMPNVDIALPSSVKYLKAGGGQFNGCKLHKLVIPKNCIVNGGTLLGCLPEILEFHGTYIDAETVSFGTSGQIIGIDTSRLKKLIIDCRNTQIVSCYGMTACEEIEVSGNVETILGGCFLGCTLVKKVTLSGNKLKEIQNGAFSGCSSLEAINIPSTITVIPQLCFEHCSSLTKVEIGSGVTNIGTAAFQYCTGLTEITIPNNVKNLGLAVFYHCSSLTKVEIGSGVTSIGNQLFDGCAAIRLLFYNAQYEIKRSLVGSGGWGNTLEKVVIGNSTPSIGSYAFVGCSGLTNVTIGNSVTSIGQNAFAGCSNLKQIKIPNSVSRIESTAFGGAGLTEIIIPTSVKFIGSSAFSGCPATKVYIPNTPEEVGDYAFSLSASNSINNTLEELYVDTDLVAGINYSTSSTPPTNLLFPPIFGSISYIALKRVELGPHVTRIGNYGFYYSQGNSVVDDREIIFGDSVKEIGSWAFAFSRLANELDLLHVERIGDRAFHLFSFAYRDVILHNIKNIGYCSFYNAQSINTLEISTEDKTLTESDIDIDYDAFTNCGIFDKLIIDIPIKFDTSSFLSTIVLRNNILLKYKTLFLGDLVYNQVLDSFDNMQSPSTIENAYFGKNIELIPDQMFENHSDLKTVKLHAKKIGNFAFSNCLNLESIEGLNSICYFGSGCFNGCRKLNLGHITVPSELDGGYLGLGAFNYTKIVSLTNNYEFVSTNQYGAIDSCTDLVEVINNVVTGGTTSEILGYNTTRGNTSLKQVVTNDKVLAWLMNFPALETIVMLNPEVTFNTGNGHVFNNSPKLKDIYIYNRTAPELGGMTFYNCAENVKVHVPANAIGYEAWVDGSTQWYEPYKLHWEIVKDLDPVYEKLVVYHDIQNTSTPTTILTNYDNSVKSIIIDDREIISEIPQGNVTYLFDTVGQHVIKVEFNDPTVVGNAAPLFNGLRTVKSVVIPDTFAAIGTNAFIGSVELTSVTIGGGVASIGNLAFTSCSNLSTITSHITNAPSVANGTFQSIKTGGTLYVPTGSSGYDTWMNNRGNLGAYNWTKVEQ